MIRPPVHPTRICMAHGMSTHASVQTTYQQADNSQLAALH